MQIPPFLRPGDTVGLLAPASPFPYAELARGLHILRHDWGLTVVEGRSLHTRQGPFAGSPELRLHDLQTMLDAPQVRAVLAARGGYGSYQLIDQVDFTAFLSQPKWVVGFSDITLLLNHIGQRGVVSLHGIMPRQFGQPDTDDALESLRRCLFGPATNDNATITYQSPAHALNRAGMATGVLIGGNLTVLLNTLGTPSEPDWAGRILFIEDIDESYFSVERMLVQLRRAGRLQQVAGVVVGQFSDLRENVSLPYGRSVQELIADQLNDLGVPVCYDFPAGHVPRNLTLPIGLPVTLTVSEAGAELTFHL
jgi:muramoyltetrapeptide carboxypeptidase